MLAARYSDMEAVRASSKAEYPQLLQHSLHSPSAPAYFDILHNRLEDHKLLRAYFAVLVRRYIGVGIRKKSSWDFAITDVKLPLIAEALMAVMYYDNQIFDKKGGVTTTEAASVNIEKGKILYDTILRYLNAAAKDKKTKERLRELVIDVHTAVQVGQKMERERNRYQNWTTGVIPPQSNLTLPDNGVKGFVKEQVKKVVLDSHLFPENKVAFLDAYLERIYWTNAYFFERISQFLLDFLAPKHPERENILRFSALFGMMHQIVNDNTDFVPSWAREETSAKICCDALSDLRNKNVTLPVAIHLLRCPNGAIETYLAANENEAVWPELRFSEEIIEHSIFESIKVGKLIKPICLQLLNFKNPQYVFLEDTAKVAENNRFYRYFYDRRESKKRKL